MKATNNGGPAFPFEYHNQTSSYQESFSPTQRPVAPNGSEMYGGLSKRQYYAAKALPACIQFTDRERWEWCVKRAFAIADEMINFEEQGK